MDKFFENLKREAEANPTWALAVAAGLFTASAKLLNASANVRNAHAWKQEVRRRAKKDAKKY
jgi:hypothetical protein